MPSRSRSIVRSVAALVLSMAIVGAPVVPATAATTADPAPESLAVHRDPTPPTAGTARTVPGQYLVTFTGRTTRAPAHAAVSGTVTAHTDATVDATRTVSPDAALITLDDPLSGEEQSTMIDALEAKSGIASVTPNQVFTTDDAALSNDPYAANGSLWNIESTTTGDTGVDANSAWPTSTGRGAVIAVVDTGYTANPDIAPNVVTGYDFVSQVTGTRSNGGYGLSRDGSGWDSDPTDPGDWCDLPGEAEASSWHGTHVAGIAAAVADNGEEVAGVAPGASIEPVRALGSCGSGLESDIIAGITWASGGTVTGFPANNHPSDVINLSLGITAACDPALQAAITAATDRGTLVVAAAGNEGAATSTSTPANCANVLDVVASTRSGGQAYYSNRGSVAGNTTIAAPGGGGSTNGDNADPIYSTVDTGTTTSTGYAVGAMIGTSMATPHVAGAAALVAALHPSYTPAQITAALAGSATPFPAGSDCTTAICGVGIVNAAAAVATSASAPVSGTPTPATYTAGKPTITGTTKVGRTLKAHPGTWTAGASRTYRWLRDGTTISGATGTSYVLRATDYRHHITVRVTGTWGTTRLQATSPRTVGVTKGTLHSTKPEVRGKARRGATLTAIHGVWTKGTHLTYRWYRNGKPIHAATKRTHRLLRADRGKRLRVKVTGKLAGYATVSRVSARTGTVA